MWFADLDHASEKRKSAPSDNQIPMKFLTGLNGATKSAAAVEERLLKRIEILEKNHGHMRLTIAGVVAVALLVGAAMYPLFLAPFYKQVEGSLDTRGSHQPATGAAATQPSQGTSTNKKGPAQ